MAELKINRKFLANPGFGIQNVGGQTLTMTVAGEVNNNVQTYKKIVFGCLFEQLAAIPLEDGKTDLDAFLNSLSLDAQNKIISAISHGDLQVWPVAGQVSIGSADGLKDITPGVADIAGSTLSAAAFRVALFKDFIDKNPAHITRMNIRAADMAALPQNVTIYTPNVFSGQYDKQIINVTADANMYQNQSSIITVSVDAFISRNCIIEFGGQFANLSTAKDLYVDVTFDKYLSLEKALYENLQLLATPAGQVSAAAEAVNEVNTQVQTAVGTAFRMPNNERTADVIRDAIRAGGTPTNVALQSWTR